MKKGASKGVIRRTLSYISLCALLLLSSVPSAYANNTKVGGANLALLGSGYDDEGQLGDGGGFHSDPVPPKQFVLPSGVTIKKAFFANEEAYANPYVITNDDRVFGAGINTAGQLGDGTFVNRDTPVQMQLPAGEVPIDISSDGYAAYVVTSSGKIFFTGADPTPDLITQNGQYQTASPIQIAIPGGHKAVQIEATQYHYAALMDNGDVYTGGYNLNGQLGNGTTTSAKITKFQLPVGAQVAQMLVTHNNSKTIVITTDGRVFASGYNYNGELGNGTSAADTLTPAQFTLPAGQVASRIIWTRASTTVYVLTSSGRLFGAGNNFYGALANGTKTTPVASPVELATPDGSKITDAIQDTYTIHIITDSGKVYAAGRNGNGELGIGSLTDATALTQANLPAGEVPVKFGFGNFYYPTVFVLTQSGNVYGTGHNDYGQIGDNSQVDKNVFTKMQLPSGTQAKQIMASDEGVQVLTTDGKVFAVGVNDSNWLGVDTAPGNIIKVPMQLSFPTNFTASALMMGFDSKFVLGAFTTTSSPSPSPTPTGSTPPESTSELTNTGATVVATSLIACVLFVSSFLVYRKRSRLYKLYRS
jgi:alpha-tubulin suppressor-like RCC1 family protein